MPQPLFKTINRKIQPSAHATKKKHWDYYEQEIVMKLRYLAKGEQKRKGYFFIYEFNNWLA